MRIRRIQTPEGAVALASVHPDGTLTRLTGELFGPLQDTGENVTGKTLAPLEPRTILCIALNYRRHAEETGKTPPERPVFFMKLPGALNHPGDPIRIPQTEPPCTKVDYEVELAVVIGKPCVQVTPSEAMDYVFGYTIGNDVSARDWQGSWGGGQYCRAKSFDTFCPLGPDLVTADEIPNPGQLSVQTYVNCEKRQDSSTADMIFSVPEVISFLSQSTTLLPGTVILTGTPEGVGVARTPPAYLQDGDEVRLQIEKLGELVNPVVA